MLLYHVLRPFLSVPSYLFPLSHPSAPSILPLHLSTPVSLPPVASPYSISSHHSLTYPIHPPSLPPRPGLPALPLRPILSLQLPTSFSHLYRRVNATGQCTINHSMLYRWVNATGQCTINLFCCANHTYVSYICIIWVYHVHAINMNSSNITNYILILIDRSHFGSSVPRFSGQGLVLLGTSHGSGFF